MPFVKNIKTKIDEAKTSKVIEEKQWELNLRFLDGNQHNAFDKNLQSFLSVREGNNLPTINLLLPIYRNLVSRLVAAYPGIVVMPASPSYDDIVKAQSSELALRYYWAEEDISELVNEAVQWLIPCGNALFHTYYDPDKKKVCPEVIKPFDFYYERGIVDIRDSRWIAIRRFVSSEDLIDTYPDKRKEIEEYTSKQDASEVETNASYVDATAYYSQNYLPPGKLETFEIYDKKGNHGIVLGDIWLFEGQTPEGIYPCQHLKWTEIRNRVWGQSLLSPLIEIQSYYNRARGQILQNVELMANPKWLIPKTAGVAPNAITKKAGEKIFYNPAGGVPQQVSAATIPSYVIDNIRQLQSELMDVSGIHGSTLGKRAIGILSGKAIQEMTSSDLSTLQMTQNSMEKACMEMAKSVLVYMKAYYDEARMYKMFDKLGHIVFKAISGEDIVDTPEVFIQANTLFQSDAVERETRAIQLFQAGLIDKDACLAEIEYRTGNAYVIEKLQGIAHASEMLDLVKKGAAIEIFMTDDLKAFEKVFNDFIMGDPTSYYALPQERQDYIRDILVSIASNGQPNPEQAAAQLESKMKVFPRTAASVQGLATQGSIVAQGQTMASVLAGAEQRRDIGAMGAAAGDVKGLPRAESMTPQEHAANEAIAGNGGAVR